MEIIDSLQIIVIIINILIVTVSSNGKNVNQINDQRLYRQQQRLLQLYQQQCFNINKENQQSISIEQFFTTFNQCARPHLIRANFIPPDIFPNEFDRINQQCIYQYSLQPKWNICNQFVIDSLLKCWLQPKNFTIWFRLQLLLQMNRDSFVMLAEQIMNDCTNRLKMINDNNYNDNTNKNNVLVDKIIVDNHNRTKF
ncbi:uncharacterized protein LOC113794686 [Dermatophagoides pteronyssinus]|uniref:Uncharacterized protein n=1 Tax=Dermatophagoides pteronyssinus TaxID=6956 RepID=A0ABQ8JH16_DERPT|nr:hypothetical protein DERP_009019 [Dermatophagoides pteronyssinus]